MTETQQTITPVILSGGAGTRLWPLSRALYPKQLMPLVGETSLLQDTAKRVSGASFSAPLVICNQEHRFVVAENLRQAEVEAKAIVLEPVGRNTAPAAAVAALMLEAEDPERLMLLLPSDHVILKPSAFIAATATAVQAANAGYLVTFGITPDRPETGYGYIREGKALAGIKGCREVEAFVEKPNRKTAQGYFKRGGYYWNSGIFLFSAKRYIEELERLEPAMVEVCRRALAEAHGDLDFQRLDEEAFASIKGASIDYAVMEHTAKAAVVPVEMGWSDVGSWSALWDIGEKDASGNVVKGDVITVDAFNSYIRTGNQLTAVVGLDDVVVVVTDDAILVADKDRTQEVKKVVEELEKRGRSEHQLHNTVYRPWGHYRGIDVGERFQVKHITVKPGGILSLQKHHHRAEHWVVVSGTAKVTRGGETFLLEENQSTYIPLGTVHRLENPGKVPVRLIEVQSGTYLGEDDIVRLEDTYGRE